MVDKAVLYQLSRATEIKKERFWAPPIFGAVEYTLFCTFYTAFDKARAGIFVRVLYLLFSRDDLQCNHKGRLAAAKIPRKEK